jgi:hypothetical protein
MRRREFMTGLGIAAALAICLECLSNAWERAYSGGSSSGRHSAAGSSRRSDRMPVVRLVGFASHMDDSVLILDLCRTSDLINSGHPVHVLKNHVGLAGSFALFKSVLVVLAATCDADNRDHDDDQHNRKRDDLHRACPDRTPTPHRGRVITFLSSR